MALVDVFAAPLTKLIAHLTGMRDRTFSKIQELKAANPDMAAAYDEVWNAIKSDLTLDEAETLMSLQTEIDNILSGQAGRDPQAGGVA